MKFLVVLLAFLSGCVSTRILELGGGQYLAVQEQRGGFPDETALVAGARDAAAARCGGLDALRVSGVDSADLTASSPGNHGRGSVRFSCATPPAPIHVAAPAPAPPPVRPARSPRASR